MFFENFILEENHAVYFETARYWRILLGSAPSESGRDFSMWPFPFALEAIEFQKIHLNFLKKILYYSKLNSKGFSLENWDGFSEIQSPLEQKEKVEWKNLDHFQGGGRTLENSSVKEIKCTYSTPLSVPNLKCEI